MYKLFITILNMSITGAFVIAVICAVRLPLKRAPKIISYCLWALAGFRLVIPFSIESVLSLIPFNPQPIPTDIAMQAIPRINSGISFVNSSVSSMLPPAAPYASSNPLQVWTATGTYVWITGAAVMVLYGMVSYFMLKHKMRKAVCTETGIYEAAHIMSPFLLGFFSPRIYLPVGLSEREREYVIRHERTHIERRDYLIKFLAYFILCLHWFNPLVWAAFLLMGADMEMSCDERVLKLMGNDVKKDYSLSLLSLATERRIIGGSPLTFGEGGVKQRIKNVLNFKKQSRLIVIVSITLVSLLGAGLAVNQVNRPGNQAIDSGETDYAMVEDPPLVPPPISVNPSDLYALSDMRTPYVGNNSAVGNIVGYLPVLDDGLMQQFFSIGDDYGTGFAPNTLTIYYEPNSPQAADKRNLTNAPKNSALLFALIDNLEEVSYAFRKKPGGNELDQAAYQSSVIQSKDEVTEYIKTIGLDWEDFQNDWNGSVEKLFAGQRQARKWIDYYYDAYERPELLFTVDIPRGVLCCFCTKSRELRAPNRSLCDLCA